MDGNATALVLFSGGQDSTTCLAWALARFARVETVGFAYGQRHAVELDARPQILARLRRAFPAWAERLGEDHLLPLDVLKAIGGTALTDDVKIAMGANGLPTTFVPGRNILFLTVAAALAYRRGLRDLVGGMCETDFSGYPDCRNDTIRATEAALSLGMDTGFRIHTPLMFIDKAATWRMGRRARRHDAGRFDHRRDRHLLRRRPRAPPRLGLRLWHMPGLRSAREGARALRLAMSYSVKEIFYTLQGEGARAGPRRGVPALCGVQSVDGTGAGPPQGGVPVLRHGVRRHRWNGWRGVSRCCRSCPGRR